MTQLSNRDLANAKANLTRLIARYQDYPDPATMELVHYASDVVEFMQRGDK